jgi:hypothetical protein
MYRTSDPRAALEQAYLACLERYQALLEASVEGRQASLRVDGIVVPVYEPVPPLAVVADHEIPALIARYESLAAYFGTETARLQDAVAVALDPYRFRPLAPPPRPVPFPYALAELLRGGWIVFRWILFPPIGMIFAWGFAVLVFVHPATTLVPLLGICVYALVRGLGRIRILRRGEAVEILSRSYARGLGSSRNWPRQIARGWSVTLEAYTGPSFTTTLAYRTSSGVMGQASVGGPKYEGFLLVDPQAPARALPLTAFGSVPRPAQSGQWEPRIPARVWICSALTAALILVWLAASFLMTVSYYELV